MKNNTPFFTSELRINSQKIDCCDDLDVIMPMYNLLYHSKKFRKTTGSFWNYYRDEENSRYDNNNRDRIF